MAQPRSAVPAEQRAAAARMIGTHVAVRDATLMNSAGDPQRTEALIQLYRGAPTEYRGHLALVAGSAEYLTHGNALPARVMLTHASETGTHSPLTELMRTAVNAGIDPATLRRDYDPTAALSKADDAHRALMTRLTSFPGPAQDTQRTPPLTVPGGDSSTRRGNPGRGPDLGR